MKYSALVVASGKGTRMNLGYNKVYMKLNDGKSILEHTIAAFLSDENCSQIVVVTDPDDFRKEFTNIYTQKIVVVNGGERRQDSVLCGLYACTNDVVMIHDGARPFISKKELDSLCNVMEDNDAALLMTPCIDTVKIVKDGAVEKTLDRNTLFNAQTPQAFKTNLIISCLQKANNDNVTVTDDAMAVELYGNTKIKVVEGNFANKKITTIEDIK